MNIPPPNETVMANASRLLERLEQMEQFLRRMLVEAAAEETIRPWAIANQVCDRYCIPKAA